MRTWTESGYIQGHCWPHCTWADTVFVYLLPLFLEWLLKVQERGTWCYYLANMIRCSGGGGPNLNYFIVVQLQLSAFSPHPSAPPQQIPLLSPAATLPLGFVHVSFTVVPEPFSLLSLPPSSLAIVRLFLTSMSLVIFSLLFSSVDYVQTKGEIIWYLSLTAWLISLSKMLSSSIYAVCPKG